MATYEGVLILFYLYIQWLVVFDGCELATEADIEKMLVPKGVSFANSHVKQVEVASCHES